MIQMYVRSMRVLPSLQATVLSNATNVVVTVSINGKETRSVRLPCVLHIHAVATDWLRVVEPVEWFVRIPDMRRVCQRMPATWA